MVRSTQTDFVHQEAEKEVTRLYKEDQRYKWSSVIRQAAEKEIRVAVRDEITKGDTKEEICEQVAIRVKEIIARMLPVIETECKTVLNQIINKEVATRLSDILK